MTHEANQDDRTQLTIKNFPVEARKIAVACAANRKETMAEWFARAVRTQAAIEAGDQIIPPGSIPHDAIPRGSIPHDAIPRGSIPDDAIPRGSIPGAVIDSVGSATLFLSEIMAMHEQANVPIPDSLLRESRLTAVAMMRDLRGATPRRRAPRSLRIEGGMPAEDADFTKGKPNG